jgi:hypothetical protein
MQRALCAERKLECEADYFPSPHIEVLNAWIFISTPCIHIHIIVLKYRCNFILYRDRTRMGVNSTLAMDAALYAAHMLQLSNIHTADI